METVKLNQGMGLSLTKRMVVRQSYLANIVTGSDNAAVQQILGDWCLFGLS